jgi:hypothetical protein
MKSFQIGKQISFSVVSILNSSVSLREFVVLFFHFAGKSVMIISDKNQHTVYPITSCQCFRISFLWLSPVFNILWRTWADFQLLHSYGCLNCVNVSHGKKLYYSTQILVQSAKIVKNYHFRHVYIFSFVTLNELSYKHLQGQSICVLQRP